MALTPAEALVLLEPDTDLGREAAKVTFLGLLAEGVLRLEKEPGRLMGGTTRLRLGRQPAESPPHVAAVLDAVRYSRSGTIADVAKRLSKATHRFAGFIPSLVRPRLIQRGLLTQHSHQEQRRTLLLFRRSVTVHTYHPTEAGRREQARLRGMLDEAPQIRAALDSDPARAAAMAMALGSLLVLVPALLPFLGQIGQALAAAPPGGIGESGAAYDTSWSDTDWTAIDDAAAGIGDSLDGALSDAESGSDGDGGGSDGGGE
jgi:hypothetical protein